MGILARLREWLDGLWSDDVATEPDSAAEPEGLDPENVTEARSDSDDEAVEKLQSIRETRDGDDGENA